MSNYKDETEYQRAIQLALEGFGYATQAHEDKFARYVPDVSFSGYGVDGWIEIKYVNTLPKSPAHIDHYTRGQEKWLKDFGKKGSGHCYLLVGSALDHILIRHNALEKVRNMAFGDIIREVEVVRADTAFKLINALNKHIRKIV